MVKKILFILFPLITSHILFRINTSNIWALTPCNTIARCTEIDIEGGCQPPCIKTDIGSPLCQCVDPIEMTCIPEGDPCPQPGKACCSNAQYCQLGSCRSTPVNLPPPLVDLDALIEGMGSDKLSGFDSLGAIVSAALPLLYGITGFALFLFLIFAGFKYLTSAGDPKKLESAKGSLTAAIIGFVLIFVAYWLTQAVNYIFNLNAGF